ncbi:CsgG/HfaB family protein [Salegentibacter sediminis]|uniref:CsgG/HfaB family protein n=1 Tax=Salegentibacter sediminis TaxID=1930251 RepID=UPI0009BD7516|nr:CsgG/HfaB family protein [Salegentibacter sediminis]
MFKILKLCCAIIVIGSFSSCAAYFNQPFQKSSSRTGELTTSSKPLLDLPPASDPVEVAVYNFSDQTGQYKAVENGSTFSTAVTQGGTTILIKALEDSGWFIPIERENLSNLSTERNIIRNTKQEYIKNLNPNEPPLPALLYAGLILEGGIISYDTNIITGGIGARYFGVGGSAKYRQDRITVYLRAVSTSSGEILKTVYVSKTILSQALDGNIFRFVKFQRLLEAETGITHNEPVQMAIQDAIEKAVHDLIVEGVQDRLWSARGGDEVNHQLVSNYLKNKEEDDNTELYERLLVDRSYKNNLSFSGGIALIDGDYQKKQPGILARLEYQHDIFPHFSLGASLNYFQLDNKNAFKNDYGSFDLNAQLNLLPNDDLAPYVYAGSGFLKALDSFNNENNAEDIKSDFLKMQYGAGLRYLLSPKIGIKIFGEHHLLFDDKLDYIEQGKRNDYYYNFGIGINFYY